MLVPTVCAFLDRCSLSSAPFCVQRSSVPDLVTQAEFDELKALFSEGASFEAQGRVRHLTLLATNHAVTAAKKLGRSEAGEAFLRCLRVELPRLWQLEAEREQNEVEGVLDLLIDDEIADEEMEAPLHAELLHTCVPFESTAAEKEAVKHYKLDRIPRDLQEQMDAFRDWRMAPLCYARTGNAVVDITSWRSWRCHAVHRLLCNGEGACTVDGNLWVVCAARLGAGVAEPRRQRGLMWSTLSKEAARFPLATCHSPTERFVVAAMSTRSST